MNHFVMSHKMSDFLHPPIVLLKNILKVIVILTSRLIG